MTKKLSMSRIKLPENLSDFTAIYIQKPISSIIEELFATKNELKAIKIYNKKQAKYDINLMKEELKRLKTIEKKYNQILHFAVSDDQVLVSPQQTNTNKRRGRPRKQTAILNDIRNHLIILVSKFQTIRTAVINKIFVLSINIHH